MCWQVVDVKKTVVGALRFDVVFEVNNIEANSEEEAIQKALELMKEERFSRVWALKRKSIEELIQKVRGSDEGGKESDN